MTTHGHGYFSVHRDQFLVNFDARGLDSHLRHCISPFALVTDKIRCQKTVSIEYFVSTDRARTLISELSQGTLETKIALKWALEGARRTRNKRIARGSSRSSTESLQTTPNSKYSVSYDKNADLGLFQETQDF